MNTCPQCGRPRKGEVYQCPQCGVFYSEIDRILFEQEHEAEINTLKGRLKIILAAENRKQALLNELKIYWRNLTLKGKFTIWLIFIFIFWVVAVVL